MSHKKLLISGLKIYTETAVLEQGSVLIANGKIVRLGFDPHDPESASLEFPKNWHLVPGFIDIHVHGAAGSDAMDNDLAAMNNIARNLIKGGVTGFLATTVTKGESDMEQALTTCRDYAKQPAQDGAEFLGINLESSFLSLAKAGMQATKHLIAPNIDLFAKWQKLSGDLIKIVTVAPELPGALEFIKYLVKHKVIASIGHTDADYDMACQAIACGASHATHLFNAMRAIAHRSPNAITALLLDDNVTVELIADGVHLHPAILQLALKLKGEAKIILISDAMRAQGLNDGVYEFGGQDIIVKDQIAKLADGTLAGSTLRLDQALRNMMHFTSCSLQTALKMITENPAKELGVFAQKGSIACGKDADLVVLDDNYQVKLVIKKGEIIQHATT